jgi:hypothetical protein
VRQHRHRHHHLFHHHSQLQMMVSSTKQQYELTWTVGRSILAASYHISQSESFHVCCFSRQVTLLLLVGLLFQMPHLRRLPLPTIISLRWFHPQRVRLWNLKNHCHLLRNLPLCHCHKPSYKPQTCLLLVVRCWSGSYFTLFGSGT